MNAAPRSCTRLVRQLEVRDTHYTWWWKSPVFKPLHIHLSNLFERADGLNCWVAQISRRLSALPLLLESSGSLAIISSRALTLAPFVKKGIGGRVLLTLLSSRMFVPKKLSKSNSRVLDDSVFLLLEPSLPNWIASVLWYTKTTMLSATLWQFYSPSDSFPVFLSPSLKQNLESNIYASSHIIIGEHSNISPLFRVFGTVGYQRIFLTL